MPAREGFPVGFRLTGRVDVDTTLLSLGLFEVVSASALSTGLAEHGTGQPVFRFLGGRLTGPFCGITSSGGLGILGAVKRIPRNFISRAALLSLISGRAPLSQRFKIGSETFAALAKARSLHPLSIAL